MRTKKNSQCDNSTPVQNIESSDKEQKLIVHTDYLRSMKPQELQEYASSHGIEHSASQTKQELIFASLKKITEKNGIIKTSGVLEVLSDGFGFLRSAETNYISGPDDIYVSPNKIKRFGLRTGDTIEGEVRSYKTGEKYYSLLKLEKINNSNLGEDKNYKINFDSLTPLFPDKKLELGSIPKKDFGSRIIDIVAPIGKGQRALIVAPPRTGKTILMRNIVHAVSQNHPDAHLTVLLIGERPEEVTDMKRSVRGEVVSSTFDESPSRHVNLAEIVIAKAKRLVEQKKDVIIVLDSITRLARAYNTVLPSSGKVLTGGVDANALQRPKRLFGAARNIEGGGSLTIIATALIETGSRMDEVIFEEFKGTGNCEIVLDRKLSDKRIFPAINVEASGTRREELLIDKATLSKIWVLRRIINPMSTNESIEFLIDKLKNTKDNKEFFELMNQTSQLKR